MKTIPIALQAHYDGYAQTVAYILKITRTDSSVFGFTTHDRSLTVDAVVYESGPGLDITGIVTTAGFAVDNLELTTLDDGAVFSRDEVLAGVWNNAKFIIQKLNWSDPSNGVEPILSGKVGEATLRQGSLVFELRGMQQALQQPIGNVSTKTCRAHFADFPAANQNNLCGLAAPTFTTTSTVTGVTSNQVFVASGLTAAADDYYAEGVITWTSGNNAGLRQKVRTHAAGGALTLSLPMLLAVQVGDTFSIIAGCRKRLEEDCFTKFNNVLNFQGEPHRPTVDQITAAPEVSA